MAKRGDRESVARKALKAISPASWAWGKLLGRGEKAAAEGDGGRWRTVMVWAGHVTTALLVGTILATSFLAHAPLERYVSGLRAQPVNVSFDWPSITDPRTGKTEVWLPGAVQVELSQLATSTLSEDPFDRESLRATKQRLESTGWLRQVKSVDRRPSGAVRISGDWRVPAAVVKKDGRDYLVSRAGELLQTPQNTPIKPGSLFTIWGPYADPPAQDRSGALAYGKAWPGGDVQAAINLLAELHDIPGSGQISGIDLAGYMKSGKLVIVTDRDSRIVWGSAVDETVPGEVKPQVKKARLVEFVKRNGRIDAGQKRIEIYSQRPFVDLTADADPLEGGA